MHPQVRDRLFGYEHAFDHPVTIAIVAGLAAVLGLAVVIAFVGSAAGWMSAETRNDVIRRCRTWLYIGAAILIPLLLGAFWTILAVCVLALLCYREYARATGLFREKVVSLTVTAGIIMTTFAVLDHWYGLFVAMASLITIIIAAVGILPDRPSGYIQRVALGVLGFLLFGFALGHAGYMANDADYRPVLALIILGTELNDVFAYCVGKLFGRRKLCPNTSPNKTIEGALGALVLTTLLVGAIGYFLFRDTKLDHPAIALGLGAVVSVAGQFGDLTISSVKRDIGIKDMGTLLPGHGGVLDRFDSLLLVAPAAFHYIGYFNGFGLDGPVRLISTGAGWR